MSDSPSDSDNITASEPDRRAAFAGTKDESSRRRSSIRQSFSLKAPVNYTSYYQYKLYGRSREEEALLRAYERAVGPSYDFDPKGTTSIQHMVLISGAPGSGKTSLAQTLRRRVVKGDGGFFLSGKFQASVYEPYSAFVVALTEYTDVLLETKPHKVKAIKSALRKAISGDDEVLLQATIPSLGRILGQHNPRFAAQLSSESIKSYYARQHTSTASPDAMHRFHHCFCRCMQALLTEGPIVLFLDDLQWADTASLELLKALCWNGGEGPLLLVGAHRTLSTNDTSPLTFIFGNPELEWSSNHIRINRISLENLDEANVNDIISDLLELPGDETEQLAHVVCQQTKGNPFYVLHLLKYLSDEECLYEEDGMWKWDFDTIQRNMDSKDTLIDFIAKKLKTMLKESERMVLKVASCLGKEIDDSALALVLDSPSLTSRALESAERAGFLVFVPHEGGYRFVHDHVQDATYSLIPEETRPGFLWCIGRKLWKESSSYSLEANIFLVVDLLHAGKDLAVQPKEKYAIAELHLLAGEKAVSLSAFSDASRYFTRGIEWLPECSWLSDRELTLNLYNSAAEVAVSNSNISQVRALMEDIFAHAKCFGDKYRCYITLIVSLGQQGNIKEAASLAIEVLEELDELFPPRPTSKLTITTDLIRTKWALRGKSDSDLLSIPTMKDPRKLAAGRISTLLLRYLILARSPLLPLVTFRIIRLYILFGHFNGASVGFAFYGMMLCKFGDMEGGLRYGKLAISMLERESQTRLWQAQVFLVYYSFISFYESPLKQSLDYLKFASSISLECGNREISSLSAFMFCTNLYSSGAKLQTLDQALASHTKAMSHFKQKNTLLLMKPMQQFIRNVQGYEKEPSILSGTSFDQERSFKEAKEQGREGLLAIATYFSADVAYLFRDFERAHKICKNFRYLIKDPPRSYVYIRFMVTACLAEIATIRLLSLEHSPSSRHDRFRFKKIFKKLGKWSKLAPRNFAFRHALLEAELASIDGASSLSVVDCLELYVKAIEGAENEGFVQEAAIAYERGGDHLERMGDTVAAAVFYDRARSLYAEWGAPAKAAQMKDELMGSCHGTVSSVPSATHDN